MSPVREPDQLLRPEQDDGAAAGLPFASIILPVRNEELYISKTLECLLDQTYPRDRMEIIVVDGSSNDSTRAIVSGIAALDPRLLLLENPRQIMAAGFNVGLKAAKGDILVMMGGHTEVAATFLRTGAQLLQEGLADCVGGPVTTVGQTYTARAISLAMSSRLGVGNSPFRIGCAEPKYVDTAAFGAYTRKIIQRTGGLDEEFVRGQDDEFNYRLRKMGGRILIVPQLQSKYASRSSFASLWCQYFQYGYWKVRILQKHPRQMQWRQFVPVLFISCLVFLLIASLLVPRIGAPLLAGVLATYGLAIGLLSTMITLHDRSLAPAVALSCVVLHFSYGLGFLRGVIAFWRHWLSSPDQGDLSKTTL